MRRLRLLSSSLVVLALSTSCTDTPTTPDQSVPGPRLDVSAAAAATASFCNAASITIRDANRALPYPSTITVAGAPTGEFKITVTLLGMNHPTISDLDVLLVGPASHKVMLMSDAAGEADLQNATLTLDDDASTEIPAAPGDVLPSGSYKPTNVDSPDFMAGPAPGEPYSSTLAVFAGTNPNGPWSLFIQDDVIGGGDGAITGGWCVNIVPMNSPPAANAGGPYSGTTGSPITFDGTGSTDPNNDIQSYDWDFGDGNTGSGATVQHAYASGGTYTVKLTVTDDDGASDEATTSVTVSDVAPTAKFNAPTEVSEGIAATISLTEASAADARYAFDCGTGYGAIGTAASATCETADNGPLTVKAKIVHGAIDDLFTEYTSEITVTNVAPVATFANNGPVEEGTSFQIQLINPVDVAADLAAGLTYAFDCGSGYGTPGVANNASCPTSDSDVPVKGKVIDKDGGETEYSAIVTVTNAAPVVTSVSLPTDPVAAGTPVTLGAAFTDVGIADSHTGSFQLGAGGPHAPGVVVESNGSGSMTATATFAEAGVYTIIAHVTDDDGDTGTRSSALDMPPFVVVYEPTSGFITGGGWIISPVGAYAADPTLTGKASFGFVAKYRPGASTPSGHTQFQFKIANFTFTSTSYESLVVSSSRAKYKGQGTINGSGSYGFRVTAVDGERPGGGSADGFRIRIWDLASGQVIYDNTPGEGEDSDATSPLGGGSIVIHR